MKFCQTEAKKQLVLSQIYTDWLCTYLCTRFATSDCVPELINEENSARWKRKKVCSFANSHRLVVYLPAHKVRCIGSAYRSRQHGKFCRMEAKKGHFFCDFTMIGSYLPAHKACCVGSAYRHQKAGQRGSLYLKGKWQKSTYKNK